LFFANKATESENNLKNQENMRLFSAFFILSGHKQRKVHAASFTPYYNISNA